MISLTHALLCGIALLVLLNYFLRNQLYILGMNYIASLQANATPLKTFFFRGISMILEPATIAILLFLFLMLEKKKKEAINAFFFKLLNIALIGIAKVLYADPRPFWSSQTIDSLGMYCPKDFGNPSGHSWFTTIITLMALINQNSFTTNKGQFSAIKCAVVILLIALMPLSRMYLGAHSLNQVVEGVSYGLAMMLLYNHCGLYGYINTFLAEFNTSKHARYLVIALYGLNFLALAINWNRINPQMPSWSANMLHKCGEGFDQFNIMLGNSIIITIILGLAVGYDSMTDSDKGKAFLSGTWAINEQLLPFWKANSLYYLMQFACLASSMTVCQVLVHLLKEQGRIVTFFLSNIGAFLCGYCYSGQAWKLLYSYGIIREII